MTSSDNDDFESADEDFDDSNDYFHKEMNNDDDDEKGKNEPFIKEINKTKEEEVRDSDPMTNKKTNKEDADEGEWHGNDNWGTSWEDEIENITPELEDKCVIEEKDKDKLIDREEAKDKIATELKEKTTSTKTPNNNSNENSSGSLEESKEKEINSEIKENTSSSSWLSSGWGTSLFNAASSLTQTLSPNSDQDNSNTKESVGGFGSLFTGMTKLVEQTSSAVISGGLDTLETIGKKTMEVLQEGDPGLKKKRAALFSDRPILSQVLRDAKLKAEQEEQSQSKKNNFLKKNVYEIIFDEEQGLVHLEALEMLSKQCELRIQTRLMSSTGVELKRFQNGMREIKEAFENFPDQEQQNEELINDDALIEASLVIGNSAAVQKFLQRYSDLREMGAEVKDNIIKEDDITIENKKIDEDNEDEDEEEKKKKLLEERANRKTLQEAIRSLAILSASAMELFHKSAELILVDPKNENFEQQQKEAIKKSIAFAQISELLESFLNETAKEYSEILSTSNASNEIISNLFLDAESSASCIQEALQLCIPILQEHGIF